MGRYRTINVDLNRQYRNDLNANFAQIEQDILSQENFTVEMKNSLLTELARIEQESKDRDNALAKQNLEVLLQSIEDAKANANTSATNANLKAAYAEEQGNYAKAQGDYAKSQGDYASTKGDYANEKAVLADEAASNANLEASNLSALKVAVVDATQSANNAKTNADTATTNANNAATYATTQGDYAKQQGDAAKQVVENAPVVSVNGQKGVVELTSSDVGAIPSTEKGVANGVAGLNAQGKVVDANGNEVEGKVKTVNNVSPDGTGNISISVPTKTSDLINDSDFATTFDVSEVDNKVSLLKKVVLDGLANFNSVTGRIITHSIGHSNYRVVITPTQNSNGYLGEVWVEKSANSFKVCNSGTATTTFEYAVIV